ncbi:MAG: EAL domain-containing protein [Sphingopyxis sp.]|uniref:putative bifunctional diguanylate cyclase/phosphodiesterase n=1 Tax=Sphingopyxis sp. TaxID=1908224 RepID=UPI003D80EC5B
MVQTGATSGAILLRRLALAAVFVAGACLVHVGAEDLTTFALIAIAVGCGWAGSAWRHDWKLWRLSQRLEVISGEGQTFEIADRLTENAKGLELAIATIERRLIERHGVSGLPTREPLLDRMEADGSGVLGAFALDDFERLAGFDPDFAERVLMAIVGRIARMVPADRLIAHVDQAHFAIWYGKDVDPSRARAEIDSISYALGGSVTVDQREILPSISTRCAALIDGITPQLLLTRTLASFALEDMPETHELSAEAIAQVQERYAMEQDLRSAIGRAEFHLFFQPLIDASSQCVTGAEALIRWNHSERGSVPPAQFMPIVEASGLAEEVGLWVLNAAARQASEWQGAPSGPLQIAINISANQLHNPDFPQFLSRTLHNHSLDAACLEIELTEGVASTDDAELARLFAEIRALGVKIAIDDFGTGYSSFSTLRQLTFDKIKIDREFVTDVHRRPHSQAICQSIIALGRGLDIRVLAEGVETAAEYRWLARHGCRFFQGYYFARPLAPADFVKFLDDRASLVALLQTANPVAQLERMTS